MDGKNLKDIANAIAIFAGLYFAYKLYKHFTGGDGEPDDGYKVEEHFQDGVRLPNGQIINLVRASVDTRHIFPYQGVLYTLTSSNAAVRSPAGTRYAWQDGSGDLVVQNEVGGVTFIEAKAS